MMAIDGFSVRCGLNSVISEEIYFNIDSSGAVSFFVKYRGLWPPQVEKWLAFTKIGASLEHDVKEKGFNPLQWMKDKLNESGISFERPEKPDIDDSKTIWVEEDNTDWMFQVAKKLEWSPGVLEAI